MEFLAFDLFIGGWQCRAARAAGMRFRLVVPCLALTFLFGPMGLLTFFALRSLPRATRPGAPAASAS